MDGRPGWKIGSRRAFAEAGVCVLVLAGAVGLHARWAGWVLALALLVFFVAGSAYLLWRLACRKPGTPPQLGQVAAMPKWLKRWALGDSDQDR
jgi:hypothetical protein